MIVVRYAVCSERDKKPVTRMVCNTRKEAVSAMERLQKLEKRAPETAYWIAELGPECEAWRWLGRDDEHHS